MLIPYPPIYRLIFGILEPGGLLAGAAFAILFPNQFHHAYLGSGWLGDAARGSKAGEKGVMVAAGMGSCKYAFLCSDLGDQEADGLLGWSQACSSSVCCRVSYSPLYRTR